MKSKIKKNKTAKPLPKCIPVFDGADPNIGEKIDSWVKDGKWPEPYQKPTPPKQFFNRYEWHFQDTKNLSLALVDAFCEAIRPLKLLDAYCLELGEHLEQSIDPATLIKTFHSLVTSTLYQVDLDCDYVFDLHHKTLQKKRQEEVGGPK